jgi:hypothetical protein
MPIVETAGGPGHARAIAMADGAGPLFILQPPNSARTADPVVVLRQDVHLRGLTAARKALRALPSQLRQPQP